MTAQVIQRDRLGALTKIGQGGQGVVYRAPNVKTKFAASMVYKEYKSQTLANIDFIAVAAMPALVEDSLSYAQAERLISVAAWPCALVEEAGAPAGFVMPAIPEEFFIPLKTVKGVSAASAEFQHLLNHPSVLEARGINIDDAQRYTLLREVASALAFMHKHGVCVGDISPKNLLFSLTPHEAVYFIDCDAMRINAVTALPQVETPGWDTPTGEELATIYSDTYKLGLLALRLVTGDQDTKNPRHLPSTTPALLRQIIADTLNNQPHQRPLPEAWTYVLGHAIEEAQHQKKIAPPVSAAPAPPELPVVHSRPPIGSSAPRTSAPPTRASASPASAPPQSHSNRRLAAAMGVPLILVVLLLGAVTFAVTQFLRPDPQQSRAAPQWQPYVDYAKQFTVWMTSLSPQSADSEVQRVIDGSIGTFHDDFANRSSEFIKAILNANTTSQGTVNSAGLDSISGTTARVVVATTSKVTNAAGAVQDPRNFRLELQVEKIGDIYKVSKVEFVQ